MIYSEIDQETLDISWFFLDNNQNVCYVTSGGGKLPKSIANYSEENESVYPFFWNLAVLSEEYKENPKLEQYVKFKEEKNKKNYFFVSSFFSKRGLYCFYKTIPCNMGEYRYHLATQPEKKLNAGLLPLEILNTLNRTKIELSVENLIEFDLRELFEI